MAKRKRKRLTPKQRRAAVSAINRRRIRQTYRVKFDNANTISNAIQTAGLSGHKLRIRYVPKYGGRPVYHIVSPYEIKIKRGKGPYLYADDHTGPTRGIHSFLTHRILSAKVMKRKKAKPEWPVKLSRKKRLLS